MLNFMVNVGKYAIYGLFGISSVSRIRDASRLICRKIRLQSNHGFLGGYIGIDLASSLVIWLKLDILFWESLVVNRDSWTNRIK